MVEQLIRNERVNGSNPLSGSPLFQEDYLLKLTHLGLLAKVTEGNVWTLKVAFRRPKNGNRCRNGFTLRKVNHGKVQHLSSALQFERKAECQMGFKCLVSHGEAATSLLLD